MAMGKVQAWLVVQYEGARRLCRKQLCDAQPVSVSVDVLPLFAAGTGGPSGNTPSRMPACSSSEAV